MSFNIGLNVIEVEGTASPAIVGAPVSVAAFAVQTSRGVPDQAVQVHSYAKFAERFGGFVANAHGAYLVKGFFDNGGRTAVISRITGTGITTASLTLNDGAASPKPTVLLKAGFRGDVHPGSWANAIHVGIKPSAASAAVSSTLLEIAPAFVESSAALDNETDFTDEEVLKVKVNGVDVDLTFVEPAIEDITKATREQILNAITTQTQALTALLTEDNKLRLTAAGTGMNGTRIQVTAAHGPLKLAANTEPVRGTPAALEARATRLATVAGFRVGDVIRIHDATEGGGAFRKIVRITPATKKIEWDKDLTPATGDWDLTVTAVTFDLTVAVGGTDDEDIVETWPGLSRESDAPNSIVSRLNDPLTGSSYIRAELVDDNASGIGVNYPAPRRLTPLEPAADVAPTANDYLGDDTKHTGLYAFDAYDVQLVTCEITDEADLDKMIIDAGLTYCERRQDCIYVGAVPRHAVGGGGAVDFAKDLRRTKAYGALYGPWISVFDPLALDPLAVGASLPLKSIPPVGHVMGAFARIEALRGIWKAPAGDESRLAGALDVEYRLTDAEHTNLVKNGSVNGIRIIPGTGIVIDASRTLSTDPRWLYVNVRLLFNYVKSSLKRGLRWVRQEPNRDSLWDAIKYSTVTPFLMGLWQNGAFGTGTPEQVFTVICDASNNQPIDVDLGNLYVDILFYPSRPAETIVIRVGQQPSGASVSEA